jgi:hypothetical protein
VAGRAGDARGPSSRAALLATKRRLGVLELQAAQKGIDVPPEVVLETEDLRAEIAALE